MIEHADQRLTKVLVGGERQSGRRQGCMRHGTVISPWPTVHLCFMQGMKLVGESRLDRREEYRRRRRVDGLDRWKGRLDAGE